MAGFVPQAKQPFPAIRPVSESELSPRTRSYYRKVDFNHQSNGTAIVIIDLYCCFDFMGRTPPADLKVIELDVPAVLLDDFVDQMPAGTGHSPTSYFVSVFREPNVPMLDHISFAINTGKRYQNGQATWTFPVILVSDHNSWNIRQDLTQQYTLVNGVLTVSKGGCTLLDNFHIEQAVAQDRMTILHNVSGAGAAGASSAAVDDIRMEERPEQITSTNGAAVSSELLSIDQAPGHGLLSSGSMVLQIYRIFALVSSAFNACFCACSVISDNYEDPPSPV